MRKIPSFVIYLVVTSLIYLPVLLSPVNVDPDAQLIFPMIDGYQNISHYFELLFSYMTLDVQPVRDLSLWFDWIIFKKFDVNIVIIHNVVLWAGILTVIERLTVFLFPVIKEKVNHSLVLLYGVYPLFAASICWGVTRKHILAYLFILLATEAFLKKRNLFLFTIFYFLSIFSQPITLPWPIWATLYLILNREKISAQVRLIPAYVIMIVGIIFNYKYYAYSVVFKTYYESKTENPLEVADKFLALGHYIYQLVLPYWSATAYQLGHHSVWIGILIFTFIILALLRTKIDRRWLMIWGSFFFFPLAVVLTNPHILSDNYLLTSSFAFFVILIKVIEPKLNDLKYGSWIFGILLGCWGIKTYLEARLWTDPILYAKERNFERRPNCDSAINLARKSYLVNKKLYPEVSDFLVTQNCNEPVFKTASHAISYIYFQSYVLFYEKDFDLQKRMDTLSKLGQTTYFPKIVLATLNAQEDRRDEVDRIMNEVYSDKDQIKWSNYHEPMVAEVLAPYCLKHHMQKCLEISSHFTVKKHVLWY